MPRSFRSFSHTADGPDVGARTSPFPHNHNHNPDAERSVAAGLTITVVGALAVTPEAMQQRPGTSATARTGSVSTASGLFAKGGSIFGGTKTPASTRPSTSSGSPATHSKFTPYAYSSTTARTSTFGRKTSFSSSKSPKVPNRGRTNSTAALSVSPEKRAHSSSTHYTDTSPLPGRVPSRQETESLPKSADSFRQVAASAEAVPSPASDADSFTSTTPYSNMLVRPGTANQAMGYNGPVPLVGPMQPQSPTLENITYQHIQETSSKRISTLDYLRKAYGPLQDCCV